MAKTRTSKSKPQAGYGENNMKPLHLTGTEFSGSVIVVIHKLMNLPPVASSMDKVLQNYV